MGDFETSDIIALQHAIYNTSVKSIRQFILSLPDCDLVSLLDCYLQRYLPQRHNFDLWRANTEIPKKSQLIDSIHTWNLQNINNNNNKKSTNPNTCNHNYNILRSMQNSFAKKYYQNPKPKTRQHSLLLKILPPCLLSTIISFLSFNDRNLNKSVCFDFYQSCKDKNLLGNYHSLITDSKLRKLQRNEMDIRRFIHCKHLEFARVSSSKFGPLLVRIIAGDSTNNHVTHKSQCKYINKNHRDRNWPKKSLTKGNYTTLTIEDQHWILWESTRNSMIHLIVNLANARRKDWMGKLKENYINSLKGITKLVWTCRVDVEGKMGLFMSLMPNIESIVFVDGTSNANVFRTIQTLKNIYKTFLSISCEKASIAGNASPRLSKRSLNINTERHGLGKKLQYLDMDVRHASFWSYFDSAKDHFNCNPLYLVRFCKKLKVFRLKITPPTPNNNNSKNKSKQSKNKNKNKNNKNNKNKNKNTNKNNNKNTYDHRSLVEMIQEESQQLQEIKNCQLKHLQVIDILWQHTDALVDNLGKAEHKVVFEVIHESMRYLLSNSNKENIREFGYRCSVGSMTFFDKITKLVGECQMLKSLKIRIDDMVLNHGLSKRETDDDDEGSVTKTLLNNISKNVDDITVEMFAAKSSSLMVNEIKAMIASNRLSSLS